MYSPEIKLQGIGEIKFSTVPCRHYDRLGGVQFVSTMHYFSVMFGNWLLRTGTKTKGMGSSSSDGGSLLANIAYIFM
jgi:hypothetical protein